jgi:branched-chain amino acid transport system ATP-binding protein
MNILQSTQVTKRFGGLTAVKDLDVSVQKESISSIIGPNGAGKTTFFNCITGYYPFEEGKIQFEEISLNGLSPDRITRTGISRTYQNIRLFSSMTALENILVGEHPHLKATLFDSILRTPRFTQEEKRAVIEAQRLLDFVGLRDLGDQLARNLPYGAQRRLEIARALANKPRLLLLDEPTAGMNPHETTEMTHFIRRLRDELGITILLIEHDMRVVMGISEWITVLDYGQKISEGTPKEVQSDVKVIEAYLGRGASGHQVLTQTTGESDHGAA